LITSADADLPSAARSGDGLLGESGDLAENSVPLLACRQAFALCCARERAAAVAGSLLDQVRGSAPCS
jgi:hypothetical protein